MAAERILYEFDAKTGQFVRAVDGASKSAKGLEKQTDLAGNKATRLGTTMQSAGKSIAIAGAKMTAFGIASALAIKQFVNAANEQLEAEKRLETVATQRLKATDKEIQALKDLASETQAYGVIGDEVIISGQAQFASFTKSTKAVETLTPTLANLIAQTSGYNATSSDAVQTANLLGKAFNGNVGALTKVGITFTKAQEQVLKFGTEEERAAILAQVVTDNFGDVNRALAETPQGQWKQLTNDLGDLGEEIGIALLPVLQELVKSFRDDVLPQIEKFVTFIGNNPGIAKFIVGITGTSIVLGGLTTVFGGLISAIGGIFSGLGALTSGLGAVSKGFGAFGKGVLKLPGTIGKAFGGLGKVFAPLTKVFSGFTNLFARLTNVVTTFASTLFAPLTGAFTTFVGSISGFLAPVTAFFAPLTGLLSGLIGPILGIAGSVLGAVAPFLALAGVIGLIVGLGSEIKRVWADVFDAEAIAQFKAIFGTIVDDVKAIFDALKGGDFDAVKEKFLSLGESLGELFSLAINKLLELLIAIDWGAVLQSALDFILGLGAFIIEFLSGIDWGGLLGNILVFLLDTFTEVVNFLTEKLLEIDWLAIAGLAIAGLGALLVWLGEAFLSIDWAAVGLALLGALKSALGLIWALIKAIPWVQIAMALFSALASIPGKLLNLFKSVNWGAVATALFTVLAGLPVKLLNKFKSIDWSGLGTTIWNAIKTATANIGSYLTGLADKALSKLNPFDMAMQGFVQNLNLSPIGGAGAFESGNTYNEFNYNFGKDGTGFNNLSRISNRLQTVNGG